MYQNTYNLNMMTLGFTIFLLSLIAAVAIIIVIMYYIFRSPFHYPYFTYSFDVSGKRKPQMEDYIDSFLNAGNFELIEKHNDKIQSWKEECQEEIEDSVIKKYRMKQYQKCLDDEHAFQFSFTRQQTRYRQANYVKEAYKVTRVADQVDCDYAYLRSRDKKLEAIGYECTLREYHCKNQRRLVTKEIRKKIMERDNYTCQNCGKYMPDEVGLHVDHIIPVSKGGKTVGSNLQVLCSKCNGSKSNKYQVS